MFGAIIGDIIGSKFEFDIGPESKDFELFSESDCFTDDTVMTCAVAEALLQAGNKNEDEFKKTLIASMKKWGKRYPEAGYGGMFYRWIFENDAKPYGSYGNGSAMRVSPVGWNYDTMEKTREVARWTAEVTHNHPEGIKGAEAVAAAIFMARNRDSKEEIKEYIEKEFGYKFERSLADIVQNDRDFVDCMHSVPEAIKCYLEGTGYEDVIRNVMYIGGDTDTLGAIAGAIAEAAYGIPMDILTTGRTYLEEDINNLMEEFYMKLCEENDEADSDDIDLKDLKALIDKALDSRDNDDFIRVCVELISLMHMKEQAYTQMRDVTGATRVINEETAVCGAKFTINEDLRLRFQYVLNDRRENWIALFTDKEERDKSADAMITINMDIEDMLREGLRCDIVTGVVINPFGRPLALDKTNLKMVLDIFDKQKEAEQKV